ncbi:MAG TPA: coenzyme F420-0:L-glutamate ligase [Thermomicrobiales bacterium]|nr:coenzyme F420-0:L-glutamate ligase [Thermomicrobiales bacterium]
MGDVESTGRAEKESVSILPIDGIGNVGPGDPLEQMIGDAIAESVGELRWGDVVVVTHKIVSKAEGQLVDLGTVEPSPFALDYAATWGKDPRQVEMVLRQSKRIIRMHRGIIIAETEHGFVCANAGVDASNAGQDMVCLLPRDPDASAARILGALQGRFFPGAAAEDQPIGVIITDSFGRPWRNGIVNVAIGIAGISPLADYRGQFDPDGYELRASILAVGDELAAAAELVMHKIAMRPVAVIRGYERQPGPPSGTGQDLVMPEERNLFP